MYDCTKGMTPKYMVVYHPYDVPMREGNWYTFHYFKEAKDYFNVVKDVVRKKKCGVVSLYDMVKDVRKDFAKGE